MEISQYQIYEIDLSNAIKGDELPENIMLAAILSPNEMNEVLKTVIIAPLSKNCALTPTTFLIDKDTRIRLDQISSIPKNRLIRHMGEVEVSQINKIKMVLNEMLIK